MYFSFSLPSWEQFCGQLFALMSLFNKGSSFPRGPHALHGKCFSPTAATLWIPFYLQKAFPWRCQHTGIINEYKQGMCKQHGGGIQDNNNLPKIKVSVCKDLKFDEDFTLLAGQLTKLAENKEIRVQLPEIHFILTWACTQINEALNQGNIFRGNKGKTLGKQYIHVQKSWLRSNLLAPTNTPSHFSQILSFLYSQAPQNRYSKSLPTPTLTELSQNTLNWGTQLVAE